MAILNILKTPLAIYNTASEVLPNLQASVNMNQGRIEMTLTIPDRITPCRVTTAIQKDPFLKIIKRLGEDITHERQFGNPRTHTLDVGECTVEGALSDWQGFQRMIYERQGNKCSQAIIAYLRNPSQQNDLAFLGLSPAQIDANPTPSDLNYFREVAQLCREMAEGDKQLINTRFGENYPQIYQRVIQELFESLRRSSPAAGPYEDILRQLQGQVIGQDSAVMSVASIVASQQRIEKNQVYLFVGPTGVGKTELAKAAAKIKDNRMVSFYMNQFQMDVDVTRFFGSSSGYVGSTDEPHLAKELNSLNPVWNETNGVYDVKNAVLLFDEFEKAHTQVKQSLLTLFDEGICKVYYSNRIGMSNLSKEFRLKSCLIICTSNLYQREMLGAFRNNRTSQQVADLFKQLNIDSPTPLSYSPELLGRMAVISFGPVQRGENGYQKIIRNKMASFFNELKREFQFADIEIENQSLILSLLEIQMYGDGIDLRRIQQHLSQIRNRLYQNQNRWPGGAKLKMVISPNQERTSFLIKIFTWIENFAHYHECASLSF